MKKPFLTFLLIGCLLSFVMSCTKTNPTADLFPKFKTEISLTADSVEMGVIIKAGNIYRAEPYIVVSDLEHADGMHFAVFDDSLRYMYSFCAYGSGPDECLMPTVVKNMPENKFLVRDHSDNYYHSYVLTDSGARNDGTFFANDFSANESVWEANNVGDSRYLIKGVSPRRTVRRLVNLPSRQVLDSLDSTFELKSIMGSDYYSEFDDFWMVANSDSFACAYYFINRIELGKINGNQIEVTKYWGVNTPPDFYRYTDEKLTGKYEYNVDYNTVYYEWLFGTESNIYASYFGLPWGDINQHSHIIEVYRYSGEPLVKCTLDVAVSSFIVLNDNKLIGINTERSDDQFYYFNINQPLSNSER